MIKIVVAISLVGVVLIFIGWLLARSAYRKYYRRKVEDTHIWQLLLEIRPSKFFCFSDRARAEFMEIRDQREAFIIEGYLLKNKDFSEIKEILDITRLGLMDIIDKEKLIAHVQKVIYLRLNEIATYEQLVPFNELIHSITFFRAPNGIQPKMSIYQFFHLKDTGLDRKIEAKALEITNRELAQELRKRPISIIDGQYIRKLVERTLLDEEARWVLRGSYEKPTAKIISIDRNNKTA